VRTRYGSTVLDPTQQLRQSSADGHRLDDAAIDQRKLHLGKALACGELQDNQTTTTSPKRTSPSTADDRALSAKHAPPCATDSVAPIADGLSRLPGSYPTRYALKDPIVEGARYSPPIVMIQFRSVRNLAPKVGLESSPLPHESLQCDSLATPRPKRLRQD
jgi:hypothetical protein